MKKEFESFLPLFDIIDDRLKKGRMTLAIDGLSASGKTTLAKLLEEKYECTVFHMDDFFYMNVLYFIWMISFCNPFKEQRKDMRT